MSVELLKKQAAAPKAAEPVKPLRVVAILSLLHERPSVNSATREFLGQRVLRLTASRVLRVRDDLQVAVACWDDQLEAVEAAMGGIEFTRLRLGVRSESSARDAVWAAGRWTDGWRSGPGDVSSFDRGWHGGAAVGALHACGDVDAVMIVDASAGLIDPALLRKLIEQAERHEERGVVFLPAAPGLGAMIVRSSVVKELGNTGGHPGKALHYVPDYFAFDPIGTPAAAPVPTAVARSLRRYLLDSPEQISRMSTVEGVMEKSAEELVGAVGGMTPGAYPRDIRLELTTERATRPVFLPHVAERDVMPAEGYVALFDELAGIAPGEWCPVRVTLGGLGDVMLYEGLERVVEMATQRGIPIAVETDLVGCGTGRVEWLARSGVDLVMVQLPAASREVYARVMGADVHEEVLANMTRFLLARGATPGRGVAPGRIIAPWLIPVFTKLRENLAEMEDWYDHYLRALGAAVIDGPAFAPHLAVAEMAPPDRRPCRRLWSRLTVLADGRVAPCELHAGAAGEAAGGGNRKIGHTTLREIWGTDLAGMRQRHSDRNYSLTVLCDDCREWHRP
jgi:MoaA/NifB/PqqE/SkfB family radical SAM enzyme